MAKAQESRKSGNIIKLDRRPGSHKCQWSSLAPFLIPSSLQFPPDWNAVQGMSCHTRAAGHRVGRQHLRLQEWTRGFQVQRTRPTVKEDCVPAFHPRPSPLNPRGPANPPRRTQASLGFPLALLVSESPTKYRSYYTNSLSIRKTPCQDLAIFPSRHFRFNVELSLFLLQLAAAVDVSTPKSTQPYSHTSKCGHQYVRSGQQMPSYPPP